MNDYAKKENYEYEKNYIRNIYGNEIANFIIEKAECLIPKKQYPKEMEWEMKCLNLFLIHKYYEQMEDLKWE